MKQDSLHKAIINKVKKEVKRSFKIVNCVGEYLTIPLTGCSETLKELTMICLENELDPRVSERAKHLNYEDKEVITVAITNWIYKVNNKNGGN